MPFDGKTYDPRYDRHRLKTQLGRVFELMQDERWRTLPEIQAFSRGMEAAVSARLRDLRKPKFGAYRVNSRRRGDPELGLWEYQVLMPESVPQEPKETGMLFDA